MKVFAITKHCFSEETLCGTVNCTASASSCREFVITGCYEQYGDKVLLRNDKAKVVVLEVFIFECDGR